MLPEAHATCVLVKSADPCLAHSCVEILRARGFEARAEDGRERPLTAPPEVVLAFCEDESDLGLLLGAGPAGRVVVCAHGWSAALPDGVRRVPLPFDGARVEAALRASAQES